MHIQLFDIALVNMICLDRRNYLKQKVEQLLKFYESF